MSRLLKVVALAGIPVTLVACATAPTRTPKLVAVSTVVDAVKEELRFVSNNLPALTRAAKPGDVCTGAGRVSSVVLTPEKVKVVLKTVVANERNPTVGLGDPIGVISIDPSFAGAYSVGQSQTLALEFGFPAADPAVKMALAAESKEVKASREATEMAEHPVARAIISSAKSLLDIDHQPPCLLPGTLTATATFDIVDKDTTGVTVKLWIFKLGEKRTRTDEAHQSMEIAYKLAGSSAAVPP